MGVIGYRGLLISKYKKCLTKILCYYDYVFIDGNCVLHETFVNGIDFFSQFSIIYDRFVKILDEFKSDNYYIVFDGRAPLNKQMTQKLRRENKFDESSLLLPDIDIIIKLEQYLIERLDSKINFILSNEIGEGEQKIFLNLKKIKHEKELNIMIISLDTDIIILSQLFLLKTSLFNIEVFIKKDNDLILNFNINELNKKMFNGNLNEDNLILFAFLSGNDFVIKNTTILCDTKSLYKIFITNKVFNINQLIFNKCVNNCEKKITKKHIKIYSNLFNWYKKYFKTNEYISCESYNLKYTPCCYCLNLYIKNTLKLIIPNKNNYHKNILPPPLYNLMEFRNEFNRLNEINI